MSATQYDFRDNQGLMDLEQIARDKIAPDYKENLRNAVLTGNFLSYVQLAGACTPECVETMTIGELRNTKVNEAGDQFIDLKAAQKVLFGRFGICRPTIGQPRKLALPIQVTYTKGQFDSEPSKPCISSGRHRLMALLILLSAAGFADYEIDEIPVRITSCVVTSNEDFAMIMEANNQSRAQKARELANHKLVASSITTNDIHELLDAASSIANAVNKQAILFAQAVSLQCQGNVERDTVFAVAKGAYTSVKSTDVKNAKHLKELYLAGNRAELASITEYVAAQVEDVYRDALVAGISVADINRLTREELARRTARRLSLVEPVFKTQEERDREKLADLEAKAAQLKRQYSA